MPLSASVTLTRNATSITINGPAGEQPVDPPPRYVTGQTTNGTVYSYQKNTSSNRVWTLNFNDLTDADKTALEDFFLNTAGGPSQTFSYTHTNGSTYTVRFMNGSLSFFRVMPNLWRVSVSLLMTTAI